MNPNVEWWSSEEEVIPYRCKTDGELHRYFVDLKIKFKGTPVYLIEIKPKKQTIPPKKPERKTKTYINEVYTWAKNKSKWEQAEKYAKQRGMVFTTWTEEGLLEMGIPLINVKKAKK